MEEKKEEGEKKEDNEEDEQGFESDGWAVFKADGIEFQLDLKQRVERERKENDAENDADKEEDDDDDAERYFIGESGLLEVTYQVLTQFIYMLETVKDPVCVA